MSECLRPQDRLKRRTDFRRVQGSAQRVHTRHFLVVLAPGLGRVGITITKKVGNAVERNRVKRLVREVFRRHRQWFPEGIDVVFIAKRGAPAVDFATVQEEVRRARRTLQRKAEGLLRAQGAEGLPLASEPE